MTERYPSNDSVFNNFPGVKWHGEMSVHFGDEHLSMDIIWDELVFNGKFSTPHFITLLIKAGFLMDECQKRQEVTVEK